MICQYSDETDGEEIKVFMHRENINLYAECVVQCEKIIEVLEKDADEISDHLQGDILDAYRSLLECEIELIQDAEKKLIKGKEMTL